MQRTRLPTLRPCVAVVLAALAGCADGGGADPPTPTLRPASAEAGPGAAPTHPSATRVASNDGSASTREAVAVPAKAATPDEYPPEEPLEKVELTEAQWRERLTAERFYILRQDGTERAFTGEYWDHKAEGVYRCAGCDLPLYHSSTKYRSGTGWPSFYEPIDPDHVGTKVDRSFGMVRTEVHCARCKGHLGHVFPDGPPPTGLRHCLNSAALVFAPADGVD